MRPPPGAADDPRAGFGAPAWLALGVGLALASACLAVGRGFNPYDEAWFLQVVDRVVSGEALYRDVYYSPLPLAVYLTAGLAAVTTVHAFVVDAVLAASATASCLLVGWAALRLGCTRPAAAAAAIGTLLVAPPQNTAPYGALAATFVVGSLVVLVGPSPMTVARAAAAGILVGLAFASKQNVGGFTAVAALVGVVVTGGRLRAVGALVGAAVATPFLVLVPVALQGGLGELYDVGFANKHTYLDVASISYVHSLRALDAGLRLRRPFESPLDWVWDSSVVLLPIVAVVALVLGLALGRRDRRGLVISGVYAAAAFAGAYPRYDYVHLAAAAPCLVVVVAAAWAQFPRSIGRRTDRFAFGVIAVAAVLFVVATLRAADDLTASALPHMEGIRISPEWEAMGQRWREGPVHGLRVFIVRQDAGFAYLVSRATNPTRFDYPATSNIGPAQLRQIRKAIEDRTIERACIGGPPGFLEPTAVDALVIRTMHHVRSAGLCELYAAR